MIDWTNGWLWVIAALLLALIEMILPGHVFVGMAGAVAVMEVLLDVELAVGHGWLWDLNGMADSIRCHVTDQPLLVFPPFRVSSAHRLARRARRP